MSPLIALCFVVSGSTSLILQVVWVRKLTEVFGSSTLAISTVLATFMAGLALGSWLGGRLADRLPRERPKRVWPRLIATPLFYYAACEAAVGAVALLVPHLVEAYRPLNATLWAHLGDTPMLLAAARFVLTAAVLMVPTTAMGATLPLLGRQVTRDQSDFRDLSRRLGILYASNTAGAVLGAALAGFLFIPLLGASATNLLAASFAAGLAAVIVLALVIRGRVPRPPSLAEQADQLTETADPPPLPSPAHRRLALLAYAVSGATAMALEVLWSRALAVVIGSSVYSFTLILVVFLVGLSVGSALFSRRAQSTRDPFGLLAVIFGATGLAIVLTHLVIDDLPTMFLAMASSASMSAGSLLSVHSVLAGLVILPAAVGLGAVMPVAMRAYVGSVNAVGRDVGRAYAANTVGAITGSLLGGVLVMPALGIERGVLLCALIYALCAAALAVPAELRRRRLTSALALLVVVGSIVTPRWNRSDFTAGLFRTHLARHYLSEGGLFERNVVYYADGIATTVSVERSESQWTLKNNGKTEASNKTDMPTQILVGLLPVMLHPGNEQDVFVVGYGSGVTIGAITQAPSVQRVDVVELESRVLEAADRFFSDFNNRPQDDPKVHRYIGDGRDVLLASGRSYDVIVSEPSNPWMTGVSSLFTREFYAFAKDHLAEDGVFCQWAQLYELGPRNVKMIYATFSEAFPYVYAFTPGDATSDTILIGTLKPLTFDLDRLASQMQNPTLRAELDRAEVERPEELIASFFLGPEDIASFTAGANINTDDNARLEFAAPLDLLSENRARLAREIRTMDWPYGRLADLVELGQYAGKRANRLAQELVGYGRYREAKDWIQVARNRGAGDEADITARLAELAEPVDFLDPDLPLTAGGPPLPDLDPSLFVGSEEDKRAGVAKLRTAYEHLAVGDWVPADRALQGLPARADTPEGRDVELVRGYLAYKSVHLRRARGILRRLASEAVFARRPTARYYLARALLGLGNFSKGRDAMLEFIRRHPDLAEKAAVSRL